jgi:hypothetical protein
VVPVGDGDGRTAEAWRQGSKAARGVAQQAVRVAAVAAGGRAGCQDDTVEDEEVVWEEDLTVTRRRTLQVQ